MRFFGLRYQFGMDLPYSEIQHLSAVRGLLISWVTNMNERRGNRRERIQNAIDEIERAVRHLVEIADMRTLERAPQELFDRYFNEVSLSWGYLVELRS